MDLIIPASGSASRINKIPKFLLPVDEAGESLLERHIRLAASYYENIIIGTRPDLQFFLNEKRLGENVRITALETGTMTETVLKLVATSNANSFSLIMPDTYFYGDSPHKFLTEEKADLQLALWRIRSTQKGKLGQVNRQGNQVIEVVDKDPNCKFKYAWGALSFSRFFTEMLQYSMPHIGYGIPISIAKGMRNTSEVIEGEYFDCGTAREYFELINKVS